MPPQDFHLGHPRDWGELGLEIRVYRPSGYQKLSIRGPLVRLSVDRIVRIVSNDLFAAFRLFGAFCGDVCRLFLFRALCVDACPLLVYQFPLAIDTPRNSLKVVLTKGSNTCRVRGIEICLQRLRDGVFRLPLAPRTHRDGPFDTATPVGSALLWR